MDGKSAEGTHTTSLPISEVIKVCDNRISSTGRCFSDTLSRDLRYQCASIAGTRRWTLIINFSGYAKTDSLPTHRLAPVSQSDYVPDRQYQRLPPFATPFKGFVTS